METMPCTHCGNVVAKSSRMCPYCGKNPLNLFDRLVINIFKIGFVLVMGFAAVNAIMNPKKPSESRSSLDSETEVESTEIQSPPSIPSVNDDRGAEQVETQVSRDEQAPGQQEVENDDKPAISPDMIDNAVKEAFETGKVVRIESDGAKGYAVPSEPQAESGCRTVEFTIDGNDRASITKTICP